MFLQLKVIFYLLSIELILIFFRSFYEYENHKTMNIFINTSIYIIAILFLIDIIFNNYIN